jgi:hypothetical protein
MTRDRTPKLRRGPVIGLGLFAASTLLGGPTAYGAQQQATLSGYQGSAQADGVHVFYNPAGALPIAPPVDLGAPDAYATIASGPATFARASAADPGDLIANPDAFLQLASSSYPAGTIPKYPFRAVANSATETHAESAPAPGLNAQADATDHGSTAQSTMPGLDAPAVASAGSISSKATTTSDGSTVTVHARSQVSDLNVLGIVTIGSVVTDVTATSDGTTTTLTGGTVVTDAEVAGMPVTIDANGIRSTPGSGAKTGDPVSDLLGTLVSPTMATVNDVLSASGLRITVLPPTKTGGDDSGQLIAGGLMIDFELSDRTAPELEQLLDTIPSMDNPVPGVPGPADLLAVVKARHLVSIHIGRGVVTLAAASGSPDPVASVDAPASPSVDVGGAPPTSSGDPLELAPTGSASVPEVTPVAPATTETTAAHIPIGAGIGAALVLALLAQPLFGHGLSKGVSTIVGAEQVSSCPWEER